MQNNGNRPAKDLKVPPKGPASYVFEIERKSALKRRITARGNLPEPGKPRRHIQTLQIAQVVALEVVEWMRARSHQTHFTAHYVPKLGQFIQAVASEKSSRTSDSGVVGHFEEWSLALVEHSQVLFQFVGVCTHGAEFVASEPPSL